ncbi:hypothetical protein O9G_005414 [Rozella allomycis CSF55]|uniref:Retroviral polymerase SH3-like domain-containing protein n=1 Tax=Rozella allomycis (strain CSF55) TaxID=988480 RepID=A0A075AYD5_ROZAC|nr:hypothetical protein O9G_005414 [Rozella allomycis CSF55]|eukprot:EPZ35104.1 hypothetical protein O9G_005414 [Rozella allomycis CSF55]
MFGETAFVVNKKPRRKTLDSICGEYIFVGYATDQKGYRLMSLSCSSVVVSRDNSAVSTLNSNFVTLSFDKTAEVNDQGENFFQPRNF